MIGNHTYKSVRLIGEGYNLYYSVWCNNEHELYDLSVSSRSFSLKNPVLISLKTDPYQLHNLYPLISRANSTEPRILGRRLSDAISRLDALLLVLKSCVGINCIEPWNVLQPDDSVRTLRDALDVEYDSFYHQQPAVSFDWCDAGYVIEAEGPQVALTRHGLNWDIWT